MLQIKNISKRYEVGDLTQVALDDVSLNLRDNEFVAILGPSGSGKTTLLNLIGGLDRYDSGDLIINHISTKKYKDRDWDSYRNHTIGFVFQSYNLIAHQTILSNVELALTISGVSRKERKKRAIEALEQVGLKDHLNKLPNQLSGGQMQRVAIARALINDPEILLADEPTGALDTQTSQQVMELLKEVARDRLVVMVTHNPELAEEYATRIVNVRDGKIISDTDPFELEESPHAQHKTMGKASMSWLTALSLSFNNLRTKKARTFLTAFAGSIGIIGIALILSLSNGVNTYIDNVQKDTMSSYPIQIDSQALNLSSLTTSGTPLNLSPTGEGESDNSTKDKVYSNGRQLQAVNALSSSISSNNLTAFKAYLDKEDNPIAPYVGENGIVYSYDVAFDVLTTDPDGTVINTDGSNLETDQTSQVMMSANQGPTMAFPGMDNTGTDSAPLFSELLPATSADDEVSQVDQQAYEMLEGNWPTNYDEVVLVLDSNNEIGLTEIYQLGLLPSKDYTNLMKEIETNSDYDVSTYEWDYKDILGKAFQLIPASDYYEETEAGKFTRLNDESTDLSELMDKGVTLKVSGVIRPSEDNDTQRLSTPIAYTRALTNYLIDYAESSAIVKAQMASKDMNVLTGMAFEPEDDAAKIDDAKRYYQQLSAEVRITYWASSTGAMEQMSMDPSSMNQEGTTDAAVDQNAIVAQADAFFEQADDATWLTFYESTVPTASYDQNLTDFGYINLDAPKSISIYSDNFQDKEVISDEIENYNKDVPEDEQIVYTDYVALLMSSVTTIINVISYVLIAFVGVSLIVSSIMIGIITYISVLERTKEIGILRAMGASKGNISQVFNAETFIVGLLSGLLGVGISYGVIVIGNQILHSLLGMNDVSASLPWQSAAILILISVVLTLIGGFIPAKQAARKDPVIALRTE